MENDRVEVLLLGTGHVAWHLARHLDNLGVPMGVVSRDVENAREWVKPFPHAVALSYTQVSKIPAKIAIACLSDKALADLATHRFHPEVLLVHTAGAVGLEVLRGHAKCGVLYPLQTFTKGVPLSLSEVPILIETDRPEDRPLLTEWAARFSHRVVYAASEDRKRLHVGAVLACNFTNHLMALSEQWLHQQGLDFGLLHPLIHETIGKALKIGPKNGQTGPSIRRDEPTLQAHLRLLSESPDLQALYQALTDSIQKLHQP